MVGDEDELSFSVTGGGLPGSVVIVGVGAKVEVGTRSGACIGTPTGAGERGREGSRSIGLHIKTGAFTGDLSLREGALTVELLSLLVSLPFVFLGSVSESDFAFFVGPLDFLEDGVLVFPVDFADFVVFS
ncbi:hypothetical protein FisN_10Lu223 [Fistulifera solaris]|uniref:Uncharacterized protein n=1 Tax=Fistulifera solaris TaxID=1519565 RepID=A0A1Z5JTK2_FISSO|nr:hypothetical protein FisN_10Lu223 [Fistulifera solaris]|eukprot:GAX17350.1 hypothetical protein FisN_10Lu223 [Fistulifera solaris]